MANQQQGDRTMEHKRETTPPPWRNPDGTRKTDAEISKLGKSWDVETWKQFLDEDVGKITEDGKLYFVKKFEDCPKLEKQTEDEEKFSNKMENLDLEVIFSLAFEELTPREQLILDKLFWEELSLRRTARALNTTPTNISTTKARVLKKLKMILTSKGFGQRLSSHLKRFAIQRPKRVRCGGNEFLKNENLNFIEDNLACLNHTERKVVECLYFKDMDLKTVASIIKKTVDETRKINKIAGDKLQRVFNEGTLRNLWPIKLVG